MTNLRSSISSDNGPAHTNGKEAAAIIAELLSTIARTVNTYTAVLGAADVVYDELVAASSETAIATYARLFANLLEINSRASGEARHRLNFAIHPATFRVPVILALLENGLLHIASFQSRVASLLREAASAVYYDFGVELLSGLLMDVRSQTRPSDLSQLLLSLMQGAPGEQELKKLVDLFAKLESVRPGCQNEIQAALAGMNRPEQLHQTGCER